MAGEDFHRIEAEGVAVVLDLRAGHVRGMAIAAEGRVIEPLHTAPWVDDPTITRDEGLPANLRFLSGDFFCAPFAASDLDEAPPHGWPANTRWRLIETLAHAEGGTIARYELERRVLGARLVKEFTLRDGHPFLYERHIFHGGHGALPVATHGMTRFTPGGRLAFSPKRYGMTPDSPLEGDPALGRSALAYPARFTDLARVPLAAGGTADLTHYPFADRNEDFVMLVEDEGSTFGWALATRPAERDIYVSLKHPADFPVTMLWFSNGGRDYSPWNGRHIGVQGIEEGRSHAIAGHKGSIAPNPLDAEGVPTALLLDPNGAVEIRNVIGGLPLPAGWTRAAHAIAGKGSLTVTDEGGAHFAVPYDETFLEQRR